MKQELADRDARLEEMEAKLRNLQGDLFAPSSERIHLATKGGIVVEEDNQDSEITHQDDGLGKRGAQYGHTGRGRKIPDSLPIVEVIHEIPLKQKVCLHCGKSYRDLNLTEDSMEIDYEVKVIVKKHRRRKAAKTCACLVPAIMTATKSPQIIPKGKFSTAFLGLIMVQKYFFQIPLNRQILQWAMEGLDVNAGTIIGSSKTIPGFITPLYNLLMTVSRAQMHWHVDETRWLVFVETPGKTSSRWWLWVFASRQATVFVLDPSRSSRVTKRHFGQDAQGVINVDCYSAYKVLEGQLQRQLCWYHVRRDFIRAKEGNYALTDWADDWISEIHWLDTLNDDRPTVNELIA
ncbi:MAG: transposase [Desulfosporosinus sp.]